MSKIIQNWKIIDIVNTQICNESFELGKLTFLRKCGSKKPLDIGEFRKITLTRTKESILFIMVVKAIKKSEHTKKENSNTLQQFVQSFKDHLVVTNDSTVIGAAEKSCF